MKLTQMTNIPMEIGYMQGSFLSVMKAFMNYAGVLEMQYCVSFAESRMQDILDDKMRLQYLPKPLRSSYMQCMRPGRLVRKMTVCFRSLSF